jgi:hypothetical protein
MAGALTTADEVAAFDPHWCLVWGKGVAAHHLAIWLPYIRRSRYRFVIVSASDDVPGDVWAAVAPVANLAVIESFTNATGPSTAWVNGGPSFWGFLYAGRKPANFELVGGFAGRTHVFIGHGESDKSSHRTASLYDALLVARYEVVNRVPRHIRRWVNAGTLAIGTPILDGATRDPWERPRPIRQVLYAPTWEGLKPASQFTSIEEAGPRLLEALPAFAQRGIRVTMRPHPIAGSRLPSIGTVLEQLEAAGMPRGTDKTADFAAADVLISDVSGVTAEFLFTEKPVIMPVSARLLTLRDERQLAAAYPWVYRWHMEQEALEDVLDRIQAGDPLRRARAKAARRMFRGHRSLDDAARTFDVALAVAPFRRKLRVVPLRLVFEASVRLPWLPGLVMRLRPRRARPAPVSA